MLTGCLTGLIAIVLSVLGSRIQDNCYAIGRISLPRPSIFTNFPQVAVCDAEDDDVKTTDISSLIQGKITPRGVC
jgi:hypothetical protein